MHTIRTALLVLASCAAVFAQNGPDPNEPPSFVISREFLENLLSQKTFLPTYKIKMQHRSDIKDPGEDCEVHLAGFVQETFTFGEPAAAIVEPPNVCKFKPNSTNPSTTSTKVIWRSRIDSKVLNKDCEVTGFPRVYTEHLSHEEHAGTSNPNHVFEIHPATRIACKNEESLDFIKNFRSFPDLRHIKASSAHDCITGFQLWVRFHAAGNHYEFAQDRPGNCGNFAIVEVTSVPQEWIQKTNGGHTAIGRVSTDGSDDLTLKFYAVEGSAADDWLDRLKAGHPQLDDPRLVHGILTYDFFAMVRAIGDSGGTLGRPTEWTEVKFPLALVVLGGTETVP
jgi:hypothetical protein